MTCGVLAPAGTPQAITDQLSEATGAVARQPEFAHLLQASGLEVRSDVTQQGAQAFLTTERQRLIPIIEMAGLERQ